MRISWTKASVALCALGLAVAFTASDSVAQQHGSAPSYSGMVPAAELLKQPVTTIFPGNVPITPDIENPLGDSPDAIERGLRDFDSFNCVGCHAANGGGGMGPSLSDDEWIYRATPANIYLTIAQGRPAGMPAWGTMLPDKTIWELVAYIKSIAHPATSFGRTISRQPPSPNIEQVPAEKLTTAHPWNYTEPFSNGQKPAG